MLIFQAVLENKTENVVVSPVSVYTLLAILQQSAGGNTQQEINNVVHAQPELTKQAYKTLTTRYRGSFSRTEVEFNTRAFAGAGLHFKSDFRQTLINNFLADIESVDFGDSANASAQINSWISQVTQHKINELIHPDELDAFTRLVLVNAIYFKSYWDNPFTSAENKAFYPTNGTEIQVATLSQVQFYHAGECSHLGAKFVHLDFVDGAEFTVLLILPSEKHGLEELVNRLTADNLTNIISHHGFKRVTLQFPTFRLKSDSNLENLLQALGVIEVFQPSADLSAMTNETLVLKKAIQKAEILIDENGVTAAAATGFTFFLPMARLPVVAEDMDFTADHPFLFFIVDRATHVPLFAGRVTNP
ncbi:hypothetical protein L9F63_020615 [Diploptera punctata]|uniref:Serpin domain-containing protein n=1 Tax=Diploptera punctata TaxID=6984 RepID=A0AAD8ECI7_DIPPU|nr:hypothetical protein L9F63_020615 [Diploptera punctata]